MSSKPGIAVWSTNKEFNVFVIKTLPNVKSVTRDPRCAAFYDSTLGYIYKGIPFFIARYDGSEAHRDTSGIFAAILIVDTNDTQDVVKEQLESMRETFGDIYIAICIPKEIGMNFGELSEKTAQLLSPEWPECTIGTEVGGEYVIRLLSHFLIVFQRIIQWLLDKLPEPQVTDTSTGQKKVDSSMSSDKKQCWCC
jgi:hypothetical protein